MRARLAPIALVSLTICAPLGAQTVIPQHAQAAGATDWFGEHILKIRGGSRIEVEPRVAGHVALFRLTPVGLRFIRLDSLPAGKQRYDLPQDSLPPSQQRVPFVVTQVSPGGNAPIIPVPPRSAPPPPPAQHVRDGIRIIMTDVALDSTELMARLALLPAVHPDSVADHVGQMLVGRRTAMWAAYYEAR